MSCTKEPQKESMTQEECENPGSTAWPEGRAYEMDEFADAATAMDAYAAFHARALTTGLARSRSLVFVPNQYGLGNRLRAMKSALLLAMLTGRVFFVRWNDPYPLVNVVQPARIDWRELDPPLERAQGTPMVRNGTATVPGGPAYMLCLPFATAPAGADCARGHRDLMSSDMRAVYEQVQSLEVHTFTDLNIFLANNPNYKALLQRACPTCRACARARACVMGGTQELALLAMPCAHACGAMHAADDGTARNQCDGADVPTDHLISSHPEAAHTRSSIARRLWP